MEQTEDLYKNKDKIGVNEPEANNDQGEGEGEGEGEVEGEEEVEYERKNFNENCVLCNKMECCLEHCCDWDSCRCGDCPNCRDPSQQQDEDVKPPRKIFRSLVNSENYALGLKRSSKPKKYIKIDKDALLITNFEVDDTKDLVDERDGVKIYGGGIRGIRALKLDKEDEEEIKDSDDDEKLKKKFIEVHGDKFRKFEHKISKKNRLIIK